MMRHIITIITLLVLGLHAHAQGGNNYSVFGFGEMRRQVGALYDGMAGTSIAMPTNHGINLVNPSLLGMTPMTRLQTGYRFNQHVNTLGNVSLAQNNGKVDGVLTLFSIDTALGIGVTFGLEPYSSVNYAVTKQLSTTVDGETVTGFSRRYGEGGLSSIVLGASVRITPTLYAGALLRSMFGNITLHDDVSVLGVGSYEQQQTIKHDVRGLLVRGGLYYEATPTLGIGAFVSGGSDANVRTTNQARGFRPGSVSFDTTQSNAFTTTLPFTYGVGVSWLSGKFRFGADVEFGDHAGLTVNTNPDVTFGQAMRASVGMSRPGSRQSTAGFTDRMGYSAGLGYQTSYFTYKGGTITEYFLGVGTDFPLGGSAIVDLGLNAGTRTSSVSGGMEELFGRVSLTVSIGEIWFKPFARD